jgi:acetaldehyde dehydrogenase (acetylating)
MLHDQDLLALQEVRAKVEAAYTAWLTYRHATQEQADAVVEALAAKGRAHARELARMAVEETGMGKVEDKLAKNMLCADLLPRSIASMKTLGVLRESPEQKVVEVGAPVGVVAAILPTTNPTSTAIYKSIIALKSGNAVVLSPHPRARNCTCTTAALLAEAAREAGAPEGIIQCIQNPALEATQALMKHPRTAVILATGGSGMVRAAYSSGRPAYGVGPGNVPVLIDASADIGDAVEKVVEGKSFDYGTVCSSEQTVVAERSLREAILAAFRANGAHLLTADEQARVQSILFKPGTAQVTTECVGQSPQKIAQLAGIQVPETARILLAEIGGVGREHPLSAEKLSPVLAAHFADSFEKGMDACETILRFGGLGHTCVIYARDEARVRQFGLRMPAFRVLVNTASPQGSVGITTNLLPSMTLGCGAMGGNVTGDNVGPQHLINIKRIAWAVRTPAEAFPQRAGETEASTMPTARAEIVAAVEKYLASRGVAGKPAPAAPAAALAAAPACAAAPAPGCGCQAARPAPAAPAGALSAVVESIVDQFLGGPVRTAGPAPAPACARPAAAAPAAAPEPPKQTLPPAPPVNIVDFVCEADVRTAMAQNKKIYIGPKTIVTPSAREAAGRDEILVMAQR